MRGCDVRDVVRRARAIVQSSAVGEVDVEARLEHPSRAALSRLAVLLSASPQDVELFLVPERVAELAERASVLGAAHVWGEPSANAIRTELELERGRATLQLLPPDATDISEVRAAIVEQLELGARLGLFGSSDPAEAIADRFFAAAGSELVAGVAGPGYVLQSRHFAGTRPRSLHIRGLGPFASGAWQRLWPNGPASLMAKLRGPSAVADAVEIWALAGDDAIAMASALLTGEAGVEALVELDWPEPCVLTWRCGFDDHGAAYHGVRVALHGRYQDGRIEPTLGSHDLVVLVDAKRHDSGRVVARVSAQSGIALERDGSGL